MKYLLILFIGAAIGIGAYVYFKEPANRPHLSRAGGKISEGADAVKEKLNDKVGALDIDRIKDELARTGTVIRKKAQQAGTAISDATADPRITAEIKGKLALESDLSRRNPMKAEGAGKTRELRHEPRLANQAVAP